MPSYPFPPRELRYRVEIAAREATDLCRDDADYWRLLALIGHMCTANHLRCLAYCLLPTRCELVLETRTPGLAHALPAVLNSLKRWQRTRGAPEIVTFARRRLTRLHSPRQVREAIARVLQLSVAEGRVAAALEWRWSSAGITLCEEVTPLAIPWLALNDARSILASALNPTLPRLEPASILGYRSAYAKIAEDQAAWRNQEP